MIALAAPSAAAAPDRDGDGIADRDDACPERAGLGRGCPPVDRDGDGLDDDRDRCPDQAGPRSNKGCADRDRDGDGVVDRRDRCPDRAGDRLEGGCVAADRDGDGWIDRRDRCPDEAEVWNGNQDGDGCADRGAARLRLVQGRIQFDGGLGFGRRGLAGDGRAALKVAAAALRLLGARKLAVEVVVTGSRSYGEGIELATGRAEEVRRVLLPLLRGRPIPIEARGLGPDGRARIEIEYH